MNAGKITILLAHAFVGWALCAATMGIGMSVTSLDNACTELNWDGSDRIVLSKRTRERTGLAC